MLVIPDDVYANQPLWWQYADIARALIKADALNPAALCWVQGDA